MTDEHSQPPEEKRGPLGDARPDATKDDPTTPGGQPAEQPEDRPNVGSVKPEDYPDKAKGA
jgi:hypothetical protein